MARADIGNSLLITRGNYRGCIGEIKEIKQLPCGLFNYIMKIEDDLAIEIPSEDCREYNPGNINWQFPYDIMNYLSTNTMISIAEEIYRTKVTEYVDAILNNRKEAGCGNIVQQVLTGIVNKYSQDMADQYKDDFLKIFKEVINMDLPASNDEDEKCFARSIQWALDRCATKYIEEHPDEIIDIMKEKIYESSKVMVDKNLSYSLSRKIEETANKIVGELFESITSNDKE